jgi:hypothetical protein
MKLWLIAKQQIDLDLDDGVKHNYELFQSMDWK